MGRMWAAPSKCRPTPPRRFHKTSNSENADVQFLPRQNLIIFFNEVWQWVPIIPRRIVGSVVDPDPQWIRTQQTLWIGIPKTDPDPQRQK